MRLNKFLVVFIVFVFFPVVVLANPDKNKIVMLIGAGDSLIVTRAFKELKELPKISERYTFEFYTDREIRNKTVKGDHIQDADIIMGDFMHSEFAGFLAANLADRKPKIYSLRAAYLADKLKKQGFTLNIQTEKYYSPPTKENVRNLILLVLSGEG